MATNQSQRLERVGVLLPDPRLPSPYAPDGKFAADELEAFDRVRSALTELEDDLELTYFDDHSRLIDDLRSNPPQLALNLCDSGFNNDWNLERDIPALLEILSIPYTGADPMAISLTTDKAVVRSLATSQAVPVPNEIFVDLRADPLMLPMLYPALIKPNASGGSFGITADCVVHSPEEAERFMRWLAPQLPTPEALIQDFLTGSEYTVGLIGNPDDDFVVLPPLEIDYGALDPQLPPILTYSSKADPESPYWNKLSFRRAELDPVKRSQLVSHCATLFRRLGIRDYARFDFRDGIDDVPRLLDVNTNPTWYHDGKMALMASWMGYDYGAMLRLILAAGARRYGLLF